MAKAKKIFKLSRTINGITYVSSKAYQPHVRAKRGTYTPITLADGMKKSAVEQSQANLMAKIVFDAVNEFAPNFKDGKFWSRLVSVFRILVKEERSNAYSLLGGMEVRPDYPISKHARVALKHNLDTVKFSCSLKIAADYRLSILRIATDQTMLVPYPNDVVVMEIAESECEGEAQLHFAPLADGAQILYVIKCEQIIKGKLEGLLSQKSVSFLKCS